MTTIHKRLEAARAIAKLSQAALAKRIGVTRSAVHQWENGQTKHVRPDNLFAVADATGTSPRWIATGKGPQAAHKRPEDALSPEVIELAKRLEALPKDRRELLMALLQQPVPDERLGRSWSALAKS